MRAAQSTHLLAAIALAACWSGAGAARADPEPMPAAPRTVIDTDGSYAVGTDIAPGTYRSAGPTANGACYWKRIRGDQIVDNALTKKPQVVQIEPTDTVFKTDHCQPWQQTACPPDCAPAPQQPAGMPGPLRDFLDHPPQVPAAGGG